MSYLCSWAARRRAEIRERTAASQQSPPGISDTNSIENNSSESTILVQCPIDLSGITANQAYTLPCGHVFHSECIKQWIRQSPNCPVCRKHIRAFDHLWNDETNEPAQGAFEQPVTAATTPDEPLLGRPFTPMEDVAANADSHRTTPAGPSSLRLLVFHVTFRTELERLSRSAEHEAGENPDDLMLEHWAAFLREKVEEHRLTIQQLIRVLVDERE